MQSTIRQRTHIRSLYGAILALLTFHAFESPKLTGQVHDPAELATLRKEYESKILNSISPLTTLESQFETALNRLGASQPNSIALQSAINQALTSMQKGAVIPASPHAEVEKMRLVLQQQEEAIIRQSLMTWQQLAASHRTAVEGIKTKLSPEELRSANTAIQQELGWLNIEQALLAQARCPWVSGDKWREISHAMEWTGKAQKTEVDGIIVLKALGDTEITQLTFKPMLPTPLELETTLVPDSKELKFFFNTVRMGFNMSSAPTTSVFRIVESSVIDYQPGKYLEPGAEQTLKFILSPNKIDISVDGKPFHTIEVDNSQALCKLSLGPAAKATTLLKSVKYRRPGSVHRPLPSDVRVTMASQMTQPPSAPAPPSPPPPPPTQPPAPALVQQPAAETTWPRIVALDATPEVTIVEENTETNRFIYRTANYEFICDSRLGTNVVREFSRIFEATYLVNCKLPLDLKPAPERLKKLFTAQLYTTKEGYIKDGGVRGSAGVYMGGEKKIMVPLSSLGVKMVGSRVSLDYRDQDHYTLIHEITHQMMNHWLRKMPVWLTEGSADFVAWAGYDNGRFNFGQTKRLIPEKLLRRGVQADNAILVELEKIMQMDGRTWNAQVTQGNASKNYATAALLTYYFYILDGDGDGANIIKLFRDLESGTPNKEAIEKHLMRGRSYAQLELDMQTAFRSEGVKLHFH